MTFLTYVGSTAVTNTATQTFTGVGFQPTAIIFWLTQQTAAGWSSAGAKDSIGFAAYNTAKSAIQQGTVSVAGIGATAAPTAYEYRRWTSSACITILQYDGTSLGQGALTSFNSDGFVITWTTQPPNAYVLNYLCLGGTDITGAGVLPWQEQGGTGAQSITGLGFQPNFLFNIGTGDPTASPSTNVHSVLSIGATDGTNQWASYGYSLQSHNPTATGRVQITSACIVDTGGSQSIVKSASFNAWLSDGFKLTWNTNNATQYYHISLCLAGPACQVGAWNKSTLAAPTNDTTSVASVPFPQAAFFFTDSNIASASPTTGMRNMFGAVSGNSIDYAAVGISEKNNVATTVDARYLYPNASIIVSNSDSTTTPDAVGALNAFGAGEFSTTWTTNNAVATQICYIVFGSSTAAPISTIPNVGWCWFSEPRAVHYQGTYDCTYFGYVQNNGNIVIAQYNNTTEELTTFLLGTFEEDDHNDPAICIRNDGTILVF